jgi:hypothetical protein
MVLHVDSMTIPGAPAQPEYIKADVYFPPHLLAELPESHHAIAMIVQTFIESIGVPVVTRWTRAAHNRGWPLNQRGPIMSPSSHFPQLVPNPVTPSSAHYIFCGRPYGSPYGHTILFITLAVTLCLNSLHKHASPCSCALIFAID